MGSLNMALSRGHLGERLKQTSLRDHKFSPNPPSTHLTTQAHTLLNPGHSQHLFNLTQPMSLSCPLLPMENQSSVTWNQYPPQHYHILSQFLDFQVHFIITPRAWEILRMRKKIMKKRRANEDKEKDKCYFSACSMFMHSSEIAL